MSDVARRRRPYWTMAGELLRPWRWQLAGALVCVAGSAGLDLAPPLIMGRLVDDKLSAGVATGLLGLALAYLGALVGVQLLRTVITVLTATVAQGALRALRVRLYDHLLRLPISFHDRTPLGDTISRCTSDMETINTLFSLGIVNLLSQVLAIAATLIAMVALSPILSLVMLFVLPIVYGITRAFQVRMRDAERQVRRGIGMINARLQEILTGVEVIHALNRAGRLLRDFRTTLVDALTATNRSVWYGSLYSPAMDVLAACTVGLLFVLGGLPGGATPLWMGVTLSAGTLTSFVLLVNRFFDPIIALGEDWGTAQAALAGIERVFQVLLVPEEEMSPVESDVREDSVAASLIDIRGLTFGYNAGDPVLRDVTLSVPAGRHVAIVGRTGAGKSSLFLLLGGLYRPWYGTVRLSGQDPFALAPASRRSLLAPVPQNVQLFSGTVRHNLTLDNSAAGNSALSDEALLRALDLAGAGELVRAMPLGLDTLLSDQGGGSGLQLSAGQRQLLALARALAGDPLVLVLDEATASVDSATEATFRQAVREHVAARGGAVLTIAHRLATALEADRVVVLAEGRIVEQGTPAELLASGGMLASLWELERAGWS